MRIGTILTLSTCLMVTSLVLASCAKSTPSSTPTSTVTTTSITVKPSTNTTATTVTTKAPNSTTSTTTTGRWWDKLGVPKYGGEIVIRAAQNITMFDPIYSLYPTIESMWMERLISDNWTLDPTVFAFTLSFRPSQYAVGQLAQTWEFTESNTFVAHLRQGIHWQNISPVNGREFVGSDIVAHYQRFYGCNSGIISPPIWNTAFIATDCQSVTATDKYTVVFKFKTPNPEEIIEQIMSSSGCMGDIEAPDAVKLWGDVNDWHHAIGTGPFILRDFVSDASATVIKNPDYWGYDERYPQNKLPYVDDVKLLIIPDNATALAGLRAGKIDALEGLSIQDSQSLKKTNPEIKQMATSPPMSIPTIDPRNDVKPFNDIKVRQAMQMSIDLTSIANNYYFGTSDPWPSGLASNYLTGYSVPYLQWPQVLKDEYAYNPTAAKKLLADAGYPTGFKTDIVADLAGDLDLLQICKGYFAAVGIDMDIRTMPTATWTAYVIGTHQHDQMAYRASGGLGISYDPFHMLLRYTQGYANNYLLVNDPVFSSFNTKAQSATTLDQVKQIVQDANLYVAQQHYAISLLCPNKFTACLPSFHGFTGQSFALSQSGGSSWATMAGFYNARFWIDQNNLK